MAMDVNKENYAEEVEKAQGYVLVDFWGPSCQPCLALMPAVEEIEKRYGGKLKVVKVDASRNRRLCIDLRVMNLPTFIIYRDGRELGRLNSKEVDVRILTGFVESHVPKNCSLSENKAGIADKCPLSKRKL